MLELLSGVPPDTEKAFDTIGEKFHRVLRDQLVDRFREVGFEEAVRTPREDVRDGLVLGTALGDAANALIDLELGELEKPATLLTIKKIAEAMGAKFRPHEIRRVREAEAHSEKGCIQDGAHRASVLCIAEEAKKQFERAGNNDLTLGKVLLSRAGLDLAPVCGSGPLGDVNEYVINNWRSFGYKATEFSSKER